MNESSTEKSRITGGCLCGAVKFSMTLPSKWCAHCHCSMCRRAHGAGYVTWVGFESDQFNLEAGENHLQWFESSPGAHRGFCKTCGSTMFFKSERWAGEIPCRTCLHRRCYRPRTPGHVFYDAHVKWMPIDEALTVFKG